MKNEQHSGGNLKDYIRFSPRSFVSSVATASVFHCVYNEQKQRETDKETGRKEGKTERKIGGEK